MLLRILNCRYLYVTPLAHLLVFKHSDAFLTSFLVSRFFFSSSYSFLNLCRLFQRLLTEELDDQIKPAATYLIYYWIYCVYVINVTKKICFKMISLKGLDWVNSFFRDCSLFSMRILKFLVWIQKHSVYLFSITFPSLF